MPHLLVVVAAGVALASPTPALETPTLSPDGVAASTSQPAEAGAVVIPKGTLVRLMVLNEVNSRKAKAGDRFVLRVDENVVVQGVTAIPVGAKAYGEVTTVRENGAVGKAGRIGARLLHIELGSRHILLEGEEDAKGASEGGRVAMAALTFGVFGLFTKGNEGKMKAGHIINGTIAEDFVFDPAPLELAVEPATAVAGRR